MKCKYGDSWERYPIRKGEIWTDHKTRSMVSVCDIVRDELPDYMTGADMIYCDPPWNLGNLNSFYTKAENINYHDSFSAFTSALFDMILRTKPAVCYLEIGKQNLGLFLDHMSKIFKSVQHWEITYYKKHPCYLIRGGTSSVAFDLTGMDEEYTPGVAVELEQPVCVADPCTGQGLTAVAAWKNHTRFVGTELNPRRLAVAIDRVNKLGGKYEGPIS